VPGQLNCARVSDEVSLSLNAPIPNVFGIRLDTLPVINLGKEVVDGFEVELDVETASEPLAGRAKDIFYIYTRFVLMKLLLE